MDSPGQNTGVGSCSLLPGIFPTQGLNPGLWHCRWILYQLSHQGSPRSRLPLQLLACILGCQEQKVITVRPWEAVRGCTHPTNTPNSCFGSSLPPSTLPEYCWYLSLLAPAAAAAAKSLQLCPTLCDPIDSSPPGFPSLGFSRQEHWSRLPFPSPMHKSEKSKWSRSVVSDSSDPMDCSLPGSSVHGIFQARVLEWGAIAFSTRNQEIFPLHFYMVLWYLYFKVAWDNIKRGIPQGSDGKESASNAGDAGSIPGSGRSPEEGNGNLLWSRCLENSMDRAAWRATVCGITKTGTWLTGLLTEYKDSFNI